MAGASIRDIFSQRLLYYMKEYGKSRNDLVRDLGFKYSTIRDWEKGITVPRMDKVEILARYFHCTNADLIEERITEEMKKDHGTITDTVVRMRTDAEFFDIVERLLKMDPAELGGVRQVLNALQAFSK